MKIPYSFLLLTCVAVTNAYGLPPVLDNSTYTSPAAANPPALPTPPASTAIETAAPAPVNSSTYYNENSSVDKLKNEVADLKSRVQTQENAINELKSSNTDLQRKLAELNKAPASVTTFKSQPASSISKTLAPVATTATTSNEKERYQNASEILKKGDYARAISEFQGLIKAYPNGEYADNAQYWIGVALLNKGDKEGAMQTFDKLAHTYPKSDKIPDALYKLGAVLVSVNNKTKAKEYFDYVIATYPTSNAAGLAKKARAGL